MCYNEHSYQQRGRVSVWGGKHSKVNSAQKRAVNAAYEWVGAMITALLIPVILFALFIRVVTVEGTSMNNTLMNNDRLVLYCYDTNYEYGDIVVIDRHTQSPLIKRVIAVGGDTVEITSDARVYRNGELLEESYTLGETERHSVIGTVTVPDGHLFVLGDNRSVSHDSRSREIGFVPVSDVVGKAILRVWPLRTFGGLYGNLDDDA